MRKSARFVAPIIKAILGILCKIDAEELKKVPKEGPYIIVMNHINFLEAPLLYGCLYPRDISGFAKAETWKQPVIGSLARIWECVPVRRGGRDIASIKLAVEALGRGKILNVMPEGTRSHSGSLGRGHAGIVSIALRSGAPLLPVAQYGGETFWHNLRRGRRTEVHFRVGPLYKLRDPGPGESKSMRIEAADEIMREIAALLPESYRGVYAAPFPPPKHLIRVDD